ncbi:hypothetical protein MRX96_047668 [Rhipicephalus microplus]
MQCRQQRPPMSEARPCVAGAINTRCRTADKWAKEPREPHGGPSPRSDVTAATPRVREASRAKGAARCTNHTFGLPIGLDGRPARGSRAKARGNQQGVRPLCLQMTDRRQAASALPSI